MDGKYKILHAIVFVVVTIFCAGRVHGASVPKYFNYQAILYDDGGNPLPDGPTILNVRLLDAGMRPVYEEEQDVEVVAGAVSVMIGAGREPGSMSLTGGMGGDILMPEGPRYLEIAAEGMPPEAVMELVAVPYSTYADMALGVVDGVIRSENIKKGAVTIDHLAEDVISKIEEKIAGGEGETLVVREEYDAFRNTLEGAAGAGEIGVIADFSYSGSADVQGVLKDFDLAIKKRHEDTKMVSQNFNGHISAANPHGVTAAQTGAVTQAALDAHKNDQNNPHGVTPEQIGAVRGSDLFDANGDIPVDKLPPEVVTEAELPPPNPDISWATVGEWRLVIGNGGVETISGDGTCNIVGSTVTCSINVMEYTCNQEVICSYTGEVSPEFRYTGIDALHGLPTIILPSGFKRWVEVIEDMSSHCYCTEKVEFSWDGQPPIGAEIRWWFYRRPIT